MYILQTCYVTQNMTHPVHSNKGPLADQDTIVQSSTEAEFVAVADAG